MRKEPLDQKFDQEYPLLMRHRCTLCVGLGQMQRVRFRSRALLKSMLLAVEQECG